ncbi:hypothetical protein V6N13_026552 [Hibiscus sabdariffa]
MRKHYLWPKTAAGTKTDTTMLAWHISTSGLTLSTATANKVTGTRQRLGGMPTAFPYSSSLASGSEHRSLRMVKAMEFSEGSLIRSVGETWQPAQTQSLTFSGPGRKPHFPSPSRSSILRHRENIVIEELSLSCFAYYESRIARRGHAARA